VTRRRTQALLITKALLLCGLIPPALYSQTPAISHTIIVLDPAHGGTDTGAHISDKLEEKDLNLAFAARLRPLLANAGFNVIATRDADPAPTAQPLTPDLRAGIANHPRALACLLIHSTPSGSGVHLYTSALSPNDTPEPSQAIPWDSAQSAYLTLSLRLANQLSASLQKASIPPVLSHATIRPLDNLTCPALAIEIAPLPAPEGGNSTPIADATYQQHIAQAVVAALVAWRNANAPATPPVTPTPKSAPPTTPAPRSTPAPVTKPTPAPTLKPATPVIPSGNPASTTGGNK
jgi:N-acetylmuramoyl-L-alanine amidase